MDCNIDNRFVQILKEELVHAQGCTEPIALALAGAKCKEVLGATPIKIEVVASGNIVKNVQGVIIPGTTTLKGVEAAVILGALGGSPDKDLEVLQTITKDNIKETETLIKSKICKVSILETKAKLHFIVKMQSEDGCASIEIMHTHTNIVKVLKNGEEMLFNPCTQDNFNSSLTDRAILTVEKIFKFAKNVDIDLVKDILADQVACNYKIAKEGLANNYGLNVGSTLLKHSEGSIKEKLKAFGSSGSDARMSGCDLPVVINSGSGNQGLTVTSPIYIYAIEKNVDDEMLYRSLVVANLIPIHIKTKIGRLSAFCGAVTAGIGVGSGLAFMDGASCEVMKNTIKNAIANLTGMICDGAKPSCAIKIASSIDAAYMAYQLAKEGMVVQYGTGIISDCIEETINNVTDIASKGMNSTDLLILDIMTK